MIIGYYPGGGGNRYHQFLNNKPFDKSGVAYDWTTTIHFRGSYLNKENQLNNTGSKDVLTHCVNYDRIQQQSNRNDIATYMLEKFKEENVEVDPIDFMKSCGLS